MNSDKLWKKIIAIVIIVIILTGIFTIYKVFTNNQSLTNESGVLGAQIKIDNGQLIDVREPDEYITSHANGAINVPLGDILLGDFSKIDNNRPLYIYCNTGVRATKAKIFLEKSGFTRVINIGGLKDWKDQGGKVCNSDSQNC